ncbi:MAG: hypothetical protein EOL98_15980 [Negativicutes bacterium]|nr:hypothetical protein [Negativicutes bacterium]
MREIKFRAWEKYEKEMSEWCDLITAIDLGYLLDEPEDFEVMQYTGLCDKNGVEIYEGDIVETVYNGEVFAGVVVYDLSEVDFKVTDGKEKYGRNFQYLAGNDENEVLGNIYENPELLKEELTC